MDHDIDEYADQLLMIHGAEPDAYPVADEIIELAGHARRLGIPNHFLDLFIWTQNVHRAVGCGDADAEDVCGCFRAAAAT
ncbi:hypothetical protein [Catenulispora rubra]|uniref:hypothetical protein n=1 Tax=Catenulispora rubra TaxID=280293 RepID=UPI00189230C4|nr:hypothetical protein [Catenulispora rubra]